MELFNAEEMYEDDYLHFFAPPGEIGAGPSDAVDLIWRELEIEPGMRVLDLCCGHGWVANQLAARGCEVTGVDSSAVFLDRARSDAAALGVDVDFVSGDMRNLPWQNYFDRVVNWTTAFGYFTDRENRRVLGQIEQALRPDGRLIMDLNNLVARVREFQESRIKVRLENGDMLVDRDRIDPLTARLEVERTVVRSGRSRELRFVVRLFSYPEISDWLTAAGFATVRTLGEDGTVLNAGHDRMILVATKSP